LAAELRGIGAQAEFIKADIRHDEEVKSLVEEPSGALAGWMLR